METPSPVTARLQRLYTLFDEAATIDGLAPLGLADERALLDRLEAEQNRPLRVAVIGEFSTGKSTFINAILGQDLLPARFLPTTRQVMRVRHTEGAPVVGLLADAGPTAGPDPGSASSPAPGPDQHGGQPLPLSPAAVRELAATGRPLDIAVAIPAPWSELVIYDTPGVNDATSMAESVVFGLMDQVDVVVMLLRAQQALTATEAAFLGQLVRQKDLDKFFFDINFSDSQDLEQGGALRSHVATTLGELRNWPIRSLRERVFLCSARRTLDAALGKADGDAGAYLNEHAALLDAVQAFAVARRQALLDDAAEGLLRAVGQAAAGKLAVALEAVQAQDAAQGRAILAITEAITGFRVAIREDELALRQRLGQRKTALLAEVDEAFTDIESTLGEWVATAHLEDLGGDEPAKRLRVAAEERLTPLLAAFRDDVGQACADLDQRIAPVVARTSEQLQGLRQGLDLGPWVAGTSLATAGYFIVSATLPWVLGATGALAVTAGLASLIPGVGAAVGALVGAGLGAAATSMPRLLTAIGQGAAGGYQWLRDLVRGWQEQRSRQAYRDQLTSMVQRMRDGVTRRLDAEIDPARIIEGALTARFPEALLLEERRLQAARLDRDRLREHRQRLADLRARFLTVVPTGSTPHD